VLSLSSSCVVVVASPTSPQFAVRHSRTQELCSGLCVSSRIIRCVPRREYRQFGDWVHGCRPLWLQGTTGIRRGAWWCLGASIRTPCYGVRWPAGDARCSGAWRAALHLLKGGWPAVEVAWCAPSCTLLFGSQVSVSVIDPRFVDESRPRCCRAVSCTAARVRFRTCRR